MLSGSEQNGGRMIANFQANAKEQIREIDTEGIGFEGDMLVVEEGIELTEKETEQGHTLLVDYTTPFGSLAVDSLRPVRIGMSASTRMVVTYLQR